MMRHMSLTFARATNSNLTLPMPENHKSSSLSRSNAPAVSTEYAWILLYGKVVKSFQVLRRFDVRTFSINK